MFDLFSVNFVGLSYSSKKRENKKAVKFVLGEHAILFDCISNIFRDATYALGIDRPVLIILVEDETKYGPALHGELALMFW